MARAAAGQPRTCLTLTIRPDPDMTDIELYRRLHAAWRVLQRQIIQQFARAPEKRWLLRAADGSLCQDDRDQRITAATPQGAYRRLHYMAFVEATKSGAPHLHILLRAPYIPQRWISQVMQREIGSPIVWIERITKTKQAIAYVAKYVTKAPARYGQSRRYWVSRDWELNKQDYRVDALFDRRYSRVVKQRYSELAAQIISQGLIAVDISPEHLRLYTPRQAVRAFGPEQRWPDRPDILRAWLRMGAIKAAAYGLPSAAVPC